MSNDSEEVVTDKNDDTGADNDTEQKEDKAGDKPQETPDAKRARLQRQLDQHNKKFGFDKKDEQKPKPDTQSTGLDYGQKAFLVANGIKGKEETELVQEVMAATGKSLEDVIESKYFQAELKERRDAKSAQDALPTQSKRSAAPARDGVDYWLSKGELPPKDQVELRRKVLNAKITKAKNGSKFYNS